MLALFKNMYFIAKVDLALLKFEALNHLCLSHGIEFNQDYRNRKAAKEMMSSISQSIRHRLIKEIEEAKYLGLTLDTSMDISCIENLSITIRYLEQKNNVCEVFLKVLSIKEKNAEFIYQTFLNFLKSTNLLNKLIGISTDGEKQLHH